MQINGTPVISTGKPNQIVWLPLGTGRVIINEQIRSPEGAYESPTAYTLHVIIPGAIDLVVSSDRAEVARLDLPENSKPVG